MEPTKKTPLALVVLAWLIVGVPWGWGVAQLWKNARMLFQAPPPAAAKPAAVQPAAADKK
jgi:hypothetical protein